MQTLLQIFKQITTIPHCSYKTEKLKEFIIDECKNANCQVKTDSAGNILAIKGNPKICLQSHYDMVCVGDAPNITIVEEDGKLKAKNSSLGADNGIGVAIMIYLLQKRDNIEALFTNDEEVGLIGANNLELPINAKYLLNLDSEEEGNICLGCAGGVDITATLEFDKVELHNDILQLYELSTRGFIGGHSGVDIDKNIKNAIKEISYYLKENDCKIISINGGEARNSIPKNVTALVVTQNELKEDENIKIKKIATKEKFILDISDELVDFLVSFPSGVRSYDKSLNLVQSSINLATIKTKKDSIEITISPRAMSNEDMHKLILETKTHLKYFEFEVTESNPYPAWKPHIGEFAKRVQEVSKKYFENPKFYAIHAGLECGVLLSKNPHLQAVSIGPNIHFPHSIREEIELESLEKVLKVVEELI